MKEIPIGKTDFKKLREENCYYVDKTKAIEDLIRTKAEVTLYTRPRRFGKSLLISTLDNFFNIEKREENKDLFKDLYIGKSEYYSYFGKYPVIRLDFKELSGNTFEDVYKLFIDKIATLFNEKSYAEHAITNEYDKNKYDMIKNGKAGLDMYKTSISFLTNVLEKYYKEKVIVLIDEYDAPINDAYINGFFDEMMDLLQPLLSSSLKGNDSLQMGVLTGVLRIGGQSLFSKFNNPKIYDVMSEHYNEYFGFTLRETKEVLEYYGLELTSEVKSYYDGYVFGDENICNPWSILNYCADKKLEPYWVSTGSNKLIKKLLKELINEEIIEDLIKGENITFTYDKSITYESFTESKNLNNLLNLLLVSGYVTYSLSEVNPITKMDRKYFKVPNVEVLEDFKNIVSSVTFNQMVADMKGYNQFIDSLASGDNIGVEKFINSILPDASYYDFKGENPYHLYMLILLSSFINKKYFEVKSNRENGSGRPDIIIKSLDKSFGLVIEIKETDDIDKMEDKASQGEKQVEKKDYILELENEGYTNIQEFVIVFCGKRAIVR